MDQSNLKEAVTEILTSDEDNSDYSGDEILDGLKIISKYTKRSTIQGAEHDMLYSISLDDLLESDTKINLRDIDNLKRMNWFLGDETGGGTFRLNRKACQNGNNSYSSSLCCSPA